MDALVGSKQLGGGVLNECVPLPPGGGCGPLVLDEQVIGLLVADIWDLTVNDMAEAGIDSITLLSCDLCVTTPEGFLKFLRPLRDTIEGPSGRELHAVRSAVDQFERFLLLRGNPKELARWQNVVDSGSIIVHESAAVQVPLWLEELCCTRLNLTISTAATVALSMKLGGTAVVDSDHVYELLRYRTDIRVIRGLSCKFRSSYLKVPVVGRKTLLDCAGPCGRRAISTTMFG
jgi:hypothetical protein